MSAGLGEQQLALRDHGALGRHRPLRLDAVGGGPGRLCRPPGRQGQHRSELCIVRILQEILSAAREVHRHGFVHRDLKFDNFRFAQGPKSELKLVDVVGQLV